MTNSGPKPGERVGDVRFDVDTMSVDLADGRTITVSLAWYPRLLEATPAHRSNCQPCGGGFAFLLAGPRQGPQHQRPPRRRSGPVSPPTRQTVIAPCSPTLAAGYRVTGLQVRNWVRPTVGLGAGKADGPAPTMLACQQRLDVRIFRVFVSQSD